MKYLTGKHALNIECELDTFGDWHQSAIQWENLSLCESQDSIFGEYGIESEKQIPNHSNKYYVANHIRALLDMLEQGNFPIAQGMKNDFICNDSYTEEIFMKVEMLNNQPHWNLIDEFMGREYKVQWLQFKEKQGNGKMAEIA